MITIKNNDNANDNGDVDTDTYNSIQAVRVTDDGNDDDTLILFNKTTYQLNAILLAHYGTINKKYVMYMPVVIYYLTH